MRFSRGSAPWRSTRLLERSAEKRSLRTHLAKLSSQPASDSTRTSFNTSAVFTKQGGCCTVRPTRHFTESEWSQRSHSIGVDVTSRREAASLYGRLLRHS